MAENISKTEVKFNQAGYQQERINDLMRVVNLCWINPIQFNERFGDYNYRIIFRVLTSYYSEIRVKFNKEKEEIDKLMEKLDNFMEYNPILKPHKKCSMYSSGGNMMSFDLKSWEIIKKCLFTYQNKILDGADAHGMGNPTKKDIRDAIIT